MSCGTHTDLAEDSTAQTATEHGVAIWTEVALGGWPLLRVTATSDGHELVYGGYFGSFELDGHEVSSPGDRTAVLANLDIYGNVEWLRHAPSPDGEETFIADAAATADGGAVLLAVAFSSIDLGCGDVAGRFVIARIDASGECLWSRRAGDPNSVQFAPYSIDVGPEDRIVVSGYVVGTLTWDDVTLGGKPLNEFPSFVLALAGDGAGLWGHTFTKSGSSGNMSIGIDSRGISTVAIPYSGTFEDQTSDSAGFDMFVAQLDGAGTLINTRSFGGYVYNNTFIDVGITGEIAVAGRFSGTLTVDGTHDLVSTSSTDNTYIVKLDRDAQVVWTKKLSGGAVISIVGVHVDYRGFVELALNAYSLRGARVLIGSFSWVASPTENAYLARFGPMTGSTQWAVRYGDPSNRVVARGLGSSPNGRVLLTGQYDGTPDFGDGALPAPPPNFQSGFVARIRQ